MWAGASARTLLYYYFHAGVFGTLNGVLRKESCMDHSLVTTNINLDGYRVVKNLGVVRGIIVRSRSVIGNIGAGIQMIFGGNISLYSELCERTRSDAYELMIQHAQERGANAVLAFRYDATEIASGVTEVLAYGTAAIVEKT